MNHTITFTNEEFLCVLDSLLIADKCSSVVGFLLHDDAGDYPLNRSLDFDVLYHRLYNEVFKCTD